MNGKLLVVAILAGIVVSACQMPDSSNSNLAKTNSGSNSSNSNTGAVNKTNASNTVNANTANSNGTVTVPAREPDKYQAKITIKFETVGDKTSAALPTVAATVARDGANHRMEFVLPNNEKLIYLDAGDKHFLIAPDRKEYAELNKDALGFEIRQLMTPAQIVEQIKNTKGVEFTGEEPLNGRTVLRYRYGATTNTQTQAGNVDTESYLLVDKETGLPLRSETLSQSQNGNVQGVRGLRIVTEMSDIKSDAPADLFAEPTGFKKVEAEEVKAQVNLVFNAITAVIGQMIKSAQTTPSPVSSSAAQ